MNYDYLHLYLQFSEVIQNVSLPGPHQDRLFLDRDRGKGSMVGKQNVKLVWMEKNKVYIPDMT